jgi:hypothetical protein
MVRLGLLVMVILAGVVFHHSGGAYDTIRALYLVLVVGFLAFAIMTRRRRSQSPGGTAGGSWGGTSGGSWGGAGVSSPPATPTAPPSDPPVGLINNEHDLGSNDPTPDPPTN